MLILVAMATRRNRKLWWCHSVFWALPPCGCESLCFAFNEDKRCFKPCVCACEEGTFTLKSVLRQPGSLWLVPWSRQCHWDYKYLHNSVAIPAITIWHLHLSMALNSQTGNCLLRAWRHLICKNMGFRSKVKQTYWPQSPCSIILTATTSHIWSSCQTILIWCMLVSDYL